MAVPYGWGNVYSSFTMRSKILITLAVLAGSLWAAEIPRKSPEFAVQIAGNQQLLVSSYRGKVLCLAFILTT